MTLVDPIGDMLTRIRNGQMRSLNKIDIPFSNFIQNILHTFYNMLQIANVRKQFKFGLGSVLPSFHSFFVQKSVFRMLFSSFLGSCRLWNYYSNRA